MDDPFRSDAHMGIKNDEIGCKYVGNRGLEYFQGSHLCVKAVESELFPVISLTLVIMSWSSTHSSLGALAT